METQIINKNGIRKAFLQLQAEPHAQPIKVTTICHFLNISRAAFVAHYPSIEELVDDILCNTANEVVESLDTTYFYANQQNEMQLPYHFKKFAEIYQIMLKGKKPLLLHNVFFEHLRMKIVQKLITEQKVRESYAQLIASYHTYAVIRMITLNIQQEVTSAYHSINPLVD
ncbi:hypothetical protein KZO01_16710 [Kurthia zopfii]|uniref:Probable dihydroxyacetone kinase regulator n=1 Tax=Kurthia zopfii TaxID=1650 RepID=A0A2U3AAT4_9BACL|nr:hypothetical protein [Kurthia zopfii]PWI21640.1 hypothetical protein DF281_11300 [Kurthia zopfii]TDR35184.1 hypothetical protein DFR61_13235 [Kurthia zopfii]STX09538.1 probable dihydroxyacetone kinase regulator [Kurthia zopfii]VEI06673.1 probable dihydroxyacetone kinase regulator [Kurthia zopfii]GEK31362.1 hypothetical protein KZO01_16710 [Kurthia zopfii]